MTFAPVRRAASVRTTDPSSPCSWRWVSPIASAAWATSSSVGFTNTPASSTRRRTRRAIPAATASSTARGTGPEDEAERPGAERRRELRVLEPRDAADLDPGHRVQLAAPAARRRGARRAGPGPSGGRRRARARPGCRRRGGGGRPRPRRRPSSAPRARRRRGSRRRRPRCRRRGCRRARPARRGRRRGPGRRRWPSPSETSAPGPSPASIPR